MISGDIGGLLVSIAIVIGFLFSAQTANNKPYRVDVCLVASGPDGEDVTTNLWSDQIKRYFERYPGSYCSKCESSYKGSCPE